MPKQIQVKDKTEPAETIKILPFRKEVKKTAAHKHNNYFEIIYLSAGNGYHSIDSRRYPVTCARIFQKWTILLQKLFLKCLLKC